MMLNWMNSAKLAETLADIVAIDAAADAKEAVS